jgi:Protein of unknown function (DUF3800)
MFGKQGAPSRSSTRRSEVRHLVKVANFYIDDSGTRHPDHKPGTKAAHGYDWFALGGVLIKSEDEAEARNLHKEFCERWEIKTPIHSVEVRSRTLNFHWLKDKTKEIQDEFYEALYQLMKAAPVTGLACVIDRPGYNARYLEKYGRQRWSLCKSAFTIGVERAAKYARSIDYLLRVCPERCNKPEDGMLKGYYEDLKRDGPPFDTSRSEKYRPLTGAEFRETLYELRPKMKTSPMAQFADLYLWPMCMGGYNPGCLPYKRLLEDGKLIEVGMPLDDAPMLGTKYYCFEGVEKKGIVTPRPVAGPSPNETGPSD